MIWRTILLILTLALGLTGPAQAQTEPPRILVMGDSLMAMNRILGGSVAQALGKALGVKVTDNSTLGRPSGNIAASICSRTAPATVPGVVLP